MKVVKIGKPQVIMSNPYSINNYFGWPTVARLQNGKIAVVASGFRIRHVCPFGKMVISYSEDEGKTYTAPAPIIDTVLDDRDGGIATFGESGVMVTSFNNNLPFQKRHVTSGYDGGYLDLITPEQEEQALGSTFRISMDCGVTFGEIYKSPVTSPHGPVEMPDGTLLWVGRTFSPTDAQMSNDRIEAHRVNLDGTMEFVGAIDNIEMDGARPLFCEPHAIVLKDGSVLVHIRAQNSEPRMFTIFQTRSCDGGKTWAKPQQILPILGGSPPHLFRTSDGLLLCTYACREAPTGIKVMFSKDEGMTWDTDYDIYANGVTWDLGYPSTVELSDGSFLTVFYARLQEGEPAVIVQQKWRLEQGEI